MRDKSEIFLNEAQTHQLFFHAIDVESAGVVGVVVLDLGHVGVALGEEFVVVEVTGVTRNAEIVAHVDRASHFLPRDECLVEFLAMAGADDLDFRLTVFGFDF